MINSRNKGASGERELSREFARLFGCDARRGQQFSGSPESPDIVIGIPNIHVECKRVERLNLYDAVKQSSRDAGANEIPVVCYRKNREDWLFIVKLNDVTALSRIFYEFQQ